MVFFITFNVHARENSQIPTHKHTRTHKLANIYQNMNCSRLSHFMFQCDCPLMLKSNNGIDFNETFDQNAPFIENKN